MNSIDFIAYPSITTTHFNIGTCFFFSSITAPQVEKKAVTGVQVITASQVQIIGVVCRPFRPAHNRQCVCVAVSTLGNRELDLNVILAHL